MASSPVLANMPRAARRDDAPSMAARVRVGKAYVGDTKEGGRPTSAADVKTVKPFVVLAWSIQQPSAPAQQPPAQQTPAQTDASRPPGTQQQQSVPTGVRPAPQNPTVPPGTQRPSPQAPPGTEQPGQQPRTSPAAPPAVQNPATLPNDPATTNTQQPALSPGQDLVEPRFPPTEARPVPPLPPLDRVGVNSGETLPLTLNEAIRRALENNNDIEIARADVRLAEAQLNAFVGVYDPVFTYTPQVNNSVRPVVNVFGGANTSGTVATTDYNHDFGVTRQFGKGGGNYQYFFNNTRETTTASNTTLNPFYSASQGVSFTQPLLRNRSIDGNRQQIRIQRKRLEQSDADFRRRTIDLIAQVQRTYWDLVFALRDEQNQIANINLARENFRRTEASVSAGASAPLQRAEIQTELSNREASLLLATQSVSIAENNLKSLLLKDPLAREWSEAILPTDEPKFDEKPISLESALTEARQNRQELRRLKIQEEISDIDLQYFRNQTKPRIDLTGTVSTNGLAGTRLSSAAITTGGTSPLILGPEFANTSATAFLLQQLRSNGLTVDPIPNVTTQTTSVPSNLIGGYGQTLQNLFGFKTRNIVVGATIQLPFHNRTAEANLATARIQRDQLAAQTRSQQQVVELEVRNAVQAVTTAQRRVLTAQTARENADLQLAGERRLFNVGRSTTFILFQRENELVNARNQELRAQTDFNKALAELQRSTSTTLKVNNVLIDSPAGVDKFRE